MASKNSFASTLAACYDKVAAGVAAVLLALGVLMLVTGGSSSARSVADFQDSLDSMKPANENLGQYVDLTPYSNALKRIGAPITIANDTNKVVGFFVPERRIWCAFKACQYPVALDAKVCPKCGKPQNADKGEVVQVAFNADTDNDGMPDDWERANGLDPQDPSDASGDKDGDGFTNLEEFLARTSPVNEKKHPPYIDCIRVDTDGVVVKRLPVMFRQRTGAPGKYSYMMSYVDEAGKTYSAMTPEGEFIKYKPQGIGMKDVITPYKVVGSVEKEEEVKFGAGTRKTLEVYAKVEREGTVFELKKNSLTDDTDYTVTLVNTRLSKAFKVEGNADFEVDNMTWKIIRVDKEANSVVLKNNADSREIKIPSR